jgi:hypothetical protein
VLDRMNAGRQEALTVADLARAMDLSSPADLDAVLSGHLAATFAMLDQFCSRFAIDKDWLTTGRAEPFTSPIEHMVLPEHYLRSIEDDQPATVYAVRSKSRVGESFLVVESDPMKFWRLPDVWHVSDHVGGGGSRDLLSLYTLFMQWSKAAKPYMVLGRYVEPEVAEDVFNGKAWPGIVANLPISHWWDDLTDIEHKWTTRTRSSKAYGKEFVAAQDIVREMLARAER